MSNYPDDMTDDDIRYVQGERSVDYAAEQFEARTDTEVLNEFFFDDLKDRSVRADEVVEWLIKNQVSLLWQIINEMPELGKEYRAYKENWIENEADEIEGKGR